MCLGSPNNSAPANAILSSTFSTRDILSCIEKEHVIRSTYYLLGSYVLKALVLHVAEHVQIKTLKVIAWPKILVGDGQSFNPLVIVNRLETIIQLILEWISLGNALELNLYGSKKCRLFRLYFGFTN